MSKDIWHTVNENPDANVGFACYRNLSHVENCTYLQNGGFQPTGSWAYIKDLLALETELERTRKALDVALCSLQNIAESNGDFITGASTPLDEHEYADMMLKEIKRQMKIKTALEQKEQK